ncbi:hypothetical protein BCV69DRAFT_298162 [Microstroma glucosiphilum]|uniref:Snf7-domain-containing protein n=1 Tax=Pseudomicrostroma glucosiphilum TaxID=1684307 RepID=A0A316UAV1_9BASI|nr:hypothetical protein BCV69DRAFT_298162 [Pseudomicrostroma glucosiphilum]PWN21964.1 hypothetical protein BCV69DRAFT_298162 [Pseudomicrostroma glucosiphilum]
MGASSSTPKITSHDRAILDLKLQRDRIRQYQKKLLTIEGREKEAARLLLARGDKARALSALRRGKYQRSMLEKTDGQLKTLEELVSNIEFSQIQASVYHGLAQGNQVLKEIHKELNTESVEKLLEETAEAQAHQREVDELLATRMTADEEAEVQAELDALEREAAGVSIVPPSTVAETDRQKVQAPQLPDAPTADPVAASPEPPVAERTKQREREREPERQAMLA